MEVVVPLLGHESLCLAAHERRCRQFGVDGLFYALLDADGDAPRALGDVMELVRCLEDDIMYFRRLEAV